MFLARLLTSLARLLERLLRAALKLVLRWLTGQSTLERMCRRGCTTKAFERELLQSRRLREVVREIMRRCDDAADDTAATAERLTALVASSKRFRPTSMGALAHCCQAIVRYRALVTRLNGLARTPYSASNPEHERMLLELWDLLRPGVPLSSRVSAQWQELGFQGHDPATDFRAAGVLGVLGLLSFVRQDREGARRRLARTNERGDAGYPFAVGGINMCWLTLELARNYTASAYFYREGATEEAFFNLFCRVFAEFDEFYFASKPKNVFDFPPILARFKQQRLQRILAVLSGSARAASASRAAVASAAP